VRAEVDADGGAAETAEDAAAVTGVASAAVMGKPVVDAARVAARRTSAGGWNYNLKHCAPSPETRDHFGGRGRCGEDGGCGWDSGLYSVH
jgi:hypothetical protein